MHYEIKEEHISLKTNTYKLYYKSEHNKNTHQGMKNQTKVGVVTASLVFWKTVETWRRIKVVTSLYHQEKAHSVKL